MFGRCLAPSHRLGQPTTVFPSTYAGHVVLRSPYEISLSIRLPDVRIDLFSSPRCFLLRTTDCSSCCSDAFALHSNGSTSNLLRPHSLHQCQLPMQITHTRDLEFPRSLPRPVADSRLRIHPGGSRPLFPLHILTPCPGLANQGGEPRRRALPG